MYCTNCGKEVNETVKFCPQCGALINETAENTGQEKDSSPQDSGIHVMGDFEPPRQATEKSGMFKKKATGLSRIKLLFAAVSVSVLAGVVMIVIVFVLRGRNPYINMVKGGSPAAYPDITYGEAFNAFFDDCEWEYFKSEDGKHVVEFHGNSLNEGEKTAVGMQFFVNMDEDTFEFYTASINGEVQDDLTCAILLLGVFESYGEDSEKGELQSDDWSGTDFLALLLDDVDTYMEDTPAENPPVAEEMTTLVWQDDVPDNDGGWSENDDDYNIGQDFLGD